MKEIILASASPRRSELLRQVGLNFQVIPSNFEENLNLELSPGELVQDLAYNKALSVAAKVKPGFLVIGADTVVVKDRVLGKPESRQHAFEMLKMLQGGWHEVITGVAVLEGSGSGCTSGFEVTRVKMRSLSDRTIEAYIDTGEPMDKAGAYGIQGLGAVIVEKIEGCYFNVVGLPLTRLSAMLESHGVNLL